MKDVLIKRDDPEYPANLHRQLGDNAPLVLYTRGNIAALRAEMIGLVCSIQCPGSIVIKTFDAIRALRDDGVVVIGGFHSPMERECLDILLRGDQPVILCPARTLHGLRLGKRPRQALNTGQLLLVSMFDESVRRTTVQQAVARNELVAAIAGAVFMPHASPGGKSWGIVATAIERGQGVFTFEDEENTPLLQAGAETLSSPIELHKQGIKWGSAW